MEITLWAYQITPGNDDLLFFAESLEACQSAALVQRAELKRRDPDDYSYIPAMAVYRMVFRPMTAAELVGVFNEDMTLLQACLVERTLVALVAE